MLSNYAVRSSPIVLFLLLQTALAWAQGDTCTTALPVISGVHLSDGPTSGDGQGGVTCGGGQDGDWYVYTATFTGMITITSCHPMNNIMDDDTYLKVLTGACGSLGCVGFNDDANPGCPDYEFASYLQVNVTAGQNYFIVWTDVFDDDAFYWELSECAGTVVGVTYTDANSNGSRDVGEPQTDVMLQIAPGGQFAYSSQDPYSFCSSIGTYTISVPDPPQYHTTVPATRTYTVAQLGDQVTGMDFGFQPIPGIHDAAVSLWGWNPWIGNNTLLHIGYSNIGTEPIDAEVVLTLDALLSYVSSSTPATAIDGQEVSWDLGVLAPGSSGTISVTVLTSIDASPGAPTLCSVVLTTQQSDIDAANNVDDLHGLATTSFDPNDKQVDRVSITPGQVADQKKLEYTIRFQNTGNAPAVNVVIKDSLDADWDLGTFEMVGATHPYTLTVGNEVAIWTFANILLPDSASDPLGSQGSFHYRMAPKATLQLGDQLTNRADIYFDYNEPVLTNTTVTTVELNTAITEHQPGDRLRAHPNPSSGLVQFTWSMGDVRSARLTVSDALGRQVHEATINGLVNDRQVQLDLGALPAGTYVARITAIDTDVRTRFVMRK